MLVDGEEVVFTQATYDGMAVWNNECRYAFSPPTSIWSNLQRAEFVRIVADCYSVGERNVRTWFSFNQRQTPFLRDDLDPETFITRVILAKCMRNVPFYENDDRIERVLIRGINYNPQGVPLRPLLYEEYYYRDTFRWEYNSHDWNPGEGSEPAEEASFTLVWYYGFRNVPTWLPPELSPDPQIEARPFTTPV